MKQILLLPGLLLGIHYGLSGQQIRMEDLDTDSWLKYHGSISAMGIWYNGMAPRDPFAYMVTGNLSFTLAGVYKLPLVFSYSDQQFRMPSPIKLNRFSFHPSYKSLQLHFGDAAMTFSPYTLNAHQFTGAGLEWKPGSHWSASLMYGRLLRPVKYDPDLPEREPVPERRGYGFQLGYTRKDWQLKGVYFRASDLMPEGAMNLLKYYPLPEVNRVLGIEGRMQVLKQGSLSFDYARSSVGIKESVSEAYGLPSGGDNGSVSGKIDFNAIKVGLTYPALQGMLGVIYERIDPGYRTFGAYYFNADLENISATVTQSLFRGKVNISLRSGMQRDNLDKAKKRELQRYVHALTMQVSPGERLSFQAAYSGFSSFTNIRNQFEKINNVNALELADTLNYRQLSSQANFSVNYRVGIAKGRESSYSLSLGFQDSHGENAKGEMAEEANSLLQGNAVYSVRSESSGWSYALSCNGSLQLGSQDRNLIWGPGAELGKHFLSGKLKSGLSLAWNRNSNRETSAGSIFNTRIRASYSLHPKHVLRLSGLYQERIQAAQDPRDITVQLQYLYTFDNIRVGSGDPKPAYPATPVTVSFRYRDVSYSGTIPEVNRQIALVRGMPQFDHLPPAAKQELAGLWDITLTQKKRGPYKLHALNYLRELYAYGDMLQEYYDYADKAMRKILHDMKKTDYELERRYVSTSRKIREQDQTTLPVQRAVLEECTRRLKGHRWMEQTFRKFRGISVSSANHAAIRTYLDAYVTHHFKAIQKGTSARDMVAALEVSLIDHLYRWSLKYTHQQKIELRYHTLKVNDQ